MAKESLADRLADDVKAEREALREALSWLTEMAGYAQLHLDPDWRRRGNGIDYESALSQARATLQRYPQ